MTTQFHLLKSVLLVAVTVCFSTQAQAAADKTPANLAYVAKPSSSYCSGDTKESTLNDGFTPGSSGDFEHGSYGNWPRIDTEWVEYDWSQPISTKQVAVYWWMDGQGVGPPKACRVLYWDGGKFMPVTNAVGLGVAGDKFNITTFDEVDHHKAAAGDRF